VCSPSFFFIISFTVSFFIASFIDSFLVASFIGSFLTTSLVGSFLVTSFANSFLVASFTGSFLETSFIAASFLEASFILIGSRFLVARGGYFTDFIEVVEVFEAGSPKGLPKGILSTKISRVDIIVDSSSATLVASSRGIVYRDKTGLLYGNY